MKLEAASLPLQKYGQASVGKNHNGETANQEFSDALKAKSGTDDKAGNGHTIKIDSKTSNGTEPKVLIKKYNLVVDQSEEIAIEDVISGTDAIEVPVDKQEGKFNERIIPHHSTFPAHQTMMERLTTSYFKKSNDQQGKIAIDEMQQNAGISRNPTKEHAFAFDMKFRAISQSELSEKGAIGVDILESPLKQKVTNNKTTGMDVDFKNLPATQISKDAAVATDRKQTVNTSALPNLAAKQISGNINSKTETSSANNNFQTQSVAKKNNVPLQNVKEKIIGEMKTGEMKTGEMNSADVKVGELKSADAKTGVLKSADVRIGELKSAVAKIGELKSADVKIGEVKLERIAPANFNQVIINALSSAGKFSPISTNVIIPGQVSTQLQKTLTIQLHPENLGVVEVKISDKNGILTISVETNTQAAEKILKAEISVLTEKLAISGILHEEMTVRNNPGLDIVKESNNQERNGGMNSNQAGEGQNAKNGENDFEQQLHESTVSDEGKIGETEQIFATSEEAGNKRDGIYL